MVTIMRLKPILAIAAFVGCVAGCLAQDPLLTGPPPVRLKVVKNSPFLAQVVIQTTQELADGNRIVHSRTATIARDSEGRTRREQGLSETDRPSEGARTSAIVFIQDPAVGVIYVLDSNSRLVRRIASPNGKTSQVPTEIRNVGPISDASKTGAANLTSESLGSQLIEGVLAEGTRTTRVIPAGQSGNEHPLRVSMETWYSPELETIVLRRTLDPRLGETIYKLTNIDRTEPLHSLFEIPRDYTLKEE
jgi:hypothetical protein